MGKKKLKILYSYDDYKNNNCKNYPEEIRKKAKRLLLLGFNMNRTKEEELEFKELSEFTKQDNECLKYTNMNFELLDLYFELKNIHDEDARKEKYQTIGIKFCELQVMIEEFESDNV